MANLGGLLVSFVNIIFLVTVTTTQSQQLKF